MAASKTKTKLPTLVHPDGREYEPSTAQEATNLVQAEGYAVKGKAELPDAFTEGMAKLDARRKTEGGAKAASKAADPASSTDAAVDTGTDRSGTNTAGGAGSSTGSTGSTSTS